MSATVRVSGDRPAAGLSEPLLFAAPDAAPVFWGVVMTFFCPPLRACVWLPGSLFLPRLLLRGAIWRVRPGVVSAATTCAVWPPERSRAHNDFCSDHPSWRMTSSARSALVGRRSWRRQSLSCSLTRRARENKIAERRSSRGPESVARLLTLDVLGKPLVALSAETR